MGFRALTDMLSDAGTTLKPKPHVQVIISLAGQRFCGYSFEQETVIVDTPLLEQDGWGGNPEQPVMDIPQAEKDL